MIGMNFDDPLVPLADLGEPGLCQSATGGEAASSTSGDETGRHVEIEKVGYAVIYIKILSRFESFHSCSDVMLKLIRFRRHYIQFAAREVQFRQDIDPHCRLAAAKAVSRVTPDYIPEAREGTVPRLIENTPNINGPLEIIGIHWTGPI